MYWNGSISHTCGTSYPKLTNHLMCVHICHCWPELPLPSHPLELWKGMVKVLMASIMVACAMPLLALCSLKSLTILSCYLAYAEILVFDLFSFCLGLAPIHDFGVFCCIGENLYLETAVYHQTYISGSVSWSLCPTGQMSHVLPASHQCTAHQCSSKIMLTFLESSQWLQKPRLDLSCHYL